MATASEAREYDKGYGRVLEVVAGGYEGRRFFRIDSDDAGAVLDATGLPSIGDEFPDFPRSGVSCKCHRVRLMVPRGGGPGPGGAGSNPGLTYAEALYRTPELTVGGGPSPEPADPVAGDSFTVINTSAGSVEVNTDISGTAIKPASRQVTEITAVVRVYKSAFAWLTEMVRIRDTRNNATVQLPNLGGYGSGVHVSFGASQLLAGAARTEIIRPGLIAAEMEFSIAPPASGGSAAPGELHKYFYVEEDDDGIPTSTVVGPVDIYPDAAWNTGTLFGAS